MATYTRDLTLSANPISFELDKTAPYAQSAKRRIELWVIENKGVIEKAATARHEPPRNSRGLGGAPSLPKAGMGPWVHNHLAYITRLLNETI